jgi:hypothetical protein
MSKKNFIEDCHAAASCTKAYCQNELNLFCEIMGLPKSNVNYFIGDDPHGVVDIMEGYYCFNMTDIHVVISEYERWLKIYGDNKGIRKAVDAWYYYRKDWYEQHSSEEPRWVSVEDGKPQVGQQVYAYLKHEKCALAAMYCKGDYGHFWGLNKERPFGDTVTHWKPIITPEQEAERSKGCPNLRSWLAGCPVEGLRDATLEWQTQREKDLQAAHQRVEEAKQALEDAIKEEVKLNKF